VAGNRFTVADITALCATDFAKLIGLDIPLDCPSVARWHAESAPDHLIVIADALSKSVVLARDEREVAAVLDLVEPFARQLAEKGRAAAGRRTILKHIGNALLVQHRVSGRVAVAEKPDVVWDRQDLDRLYARLQDGYELKERAVSFRSSPRRPRCSPTSSIRSVRCDSKSLLSPPGYSPPANLPADFVAYSKAPLPKYHLDVERIGE
jgi:hypothetical protein